MQYKFPFNKIKSELYQIKPFDLLGESKYSPQSRYSNSPACQIYDQLNEHESNNSNQNTPNKENQVGDQLDQQEKKTKFQNKITSSSKSIRARNFDFSSFINDIQNFFNQQQSNQKKLVEQNEQNSLKYNQLILSQKDSKPGCNSTMSNSPRIKRGSQKSILKPPKERILDFFNELVDVTKSPQKKKVNFAL
ncbi:hypothetical protein ABPG72_006678 [Tetrahymena utriculariae]